MLKHFRWADIEMEELNPLFRRQIVAGDKVMVARLFLKKGSHVPLHSHVNEQVSYVLEGTLKFRIDRAEVHVGAGEVLCIPPNMPHEVIALEDSLDLDIFYPLRDDWLNKTDDYLRNVQTR